MITGQNLSKLHQKTRLGCGCSMLRAAIYTTEAKEELTPRLIGKVADEMVAHEDIAIDQKGDIFKVTLFATEVRMVVFQDDLEDFIAWLKKFGTVDVSLNTKLKSAVLTLDMSPKEPKEK